MIVYRDYGGMNMTEITIESLNALIKSLKDSGFLVAKDIADRHYTIRQLYEHRLMLFKIICHTYSHLAWKTNRHFDGDMFNDSFLVGITTPLGNATYHFKKEHYDEFEVIEIEKGPKYDGYTPDDVINRINSLPLIGNHYVDTGKSTIHNDIDETYEILNQSINSKENLEDMKRLTEVINELLSLLRKMDLIKTIDIGDSNHTFKELYKQKRELFKLICHNYNDLAWKSKNDINGASVSNDTFIAGLNTPLGPVCYILNDDYYDEFNVISLSNAPIKKDEIYFDVIKKEGLLGNHDMILFIDDYKFRLANKELIKLSEKPKNVLRAYRIDSLGNLFVA